MVLTCMLSLACLSLSSSAEAEAYECRCVPCRYGRSVYEDERFGTAECVMMLEAKPGVKRMLAPGLYRFVWSTEPVFTSWNGKTDIRADFTVTRRVDGIGFSFTSAPNESGGLDTVVVVSVSRRAQPGSEAAYRILTRSAERDFRTGLERASTTETEFLIGVK